MTRPAASLTVVKATAPMIPSWPARMQVRMAAAYVGLFDESGLPDESTFREHVRKGLYCQPYKRPGERQAWLKVELDETLERMRQREKATEDEDEFE